MPIKYNEELENPNRSIGIMLNDGKEHQFRCDVYPSYINPFGEVVDVLTDHKENNFIYAINSGEHFLENWESNYSNVESINVCRKVNINIYDEKEMLETAKTIDMIRRVDKTHRVNTVEDYMEQKIGYKSIFVPRKTYFDRLNEKQIVRYTNLGEYINKRNEILKNIKEILKTKKVNSWQVYKQFNLFCLSMLKPTIENGKNEYFDDYSDELRDDVLNIMNGQIFIYDYFIKLYRNIDNPFKHYKALKKKIKNDYNDLLVSCVDFDKIESMPQEVNRRMQNKIDNNIDKCKVNNSSIRTITTSKLNPNQYFYNYLIMDWNIKQVPKFIVDVENKCIKKVVTNEYSFVSNTREEKEYEEEITLIKKYIPKSKRPNYFI